MVLRNYRANAMVRDLFEKDDDKFISDIPKEKRHLNTASYDYSVDFIVSMMQEGKIILEVPFQRQYVWKDDKASQLIESVIMNVPIPPIYFAEEEDGRWLVIDGLQRLNSLLRFSQNEFGLIKLDIIKELEKFKFKDLPPKAKSLLSNGQLRANVIRKDSHPDIKYDIFMRLNKGAVVLNYQELRNCLYRGDLNNLAKELNFDNHDFLSILGLKKPHNRFIDVEMIVRLCALAKNLVKDENGKYVISGYKGRMVAFLNDFMDAHKVMSATETDRYRNLFNGVIQRVVDVFEVEDAFRDITSSRNKVNKSLADCIFLGFVLYKDNETLIRQKRAIKSALKDLLENNDKFKSSIFSKTSDTQILNYRVDTWIKSLHNALQL